MSLWTGFIFNDQFELLEGKFWVKSSFAIVVGSMLSTWLVFVISLLIGFGRPAIWYGLVIMAIFIAYGRLKHGLDAGWFKREIWPHRKIAWPHAFVLLFVLPFFLFGFWQTEAGDIMYRGNYTDLSYHMAIISSFLEQPDFPPQNPQFAGAKMSYHFLVNFHSAILTLGGFSLFLSVLIPQILYSFALATMIYWFYKVMLRSEWCTFFSVCLFVMGHIAFFNLCFALFGYPEDCPKIDVGSWQSVREHLLFPFFNFLNPIINYFHPQRPFLLGFPLAIVVLLGIYRTFVEQEPDYRRLLCLSFLVGLLPLFHVHTFLFLLALILLASLCRKGDLKRTFLALLPLGLAAGQIWFIFSQPKAPGFSGWDVHRLEGGLTELNVLGSALLSRLVFWLRAAGFPLILGAAGFGLYFKGHREFSLETENGRKNRILVVFFAVPSAFFLLINFYRFSPNWGDSNKFFLYFALVLALFSGHLLGSWFIRGPFAKGTAILTVVVAAILPSSLEAYGVFTRSGTVLFTACDRNVAQWIRMNTPRDAVFLTSDDVIHYVTALGGRKVVNGAYTWNTGFSQPKTQSDVRRMYATGDVELMEDYGVSHLLVGPHEMRKYVMDHQALERFEMIYGQECRGMRYRIYDIQAGTASYAARESILHGGRGDGEESLFLSDMMPTKAVQDHGVLRRDANFLLGPIVLNGKRYDKGLGTHANSEIAFALGKQFEHFRSAVGLDDTQDGTPGSVVFKVYVDGNLKRQTAIMRWESETQWMEIPVKGAETLVLIVTDAGDDDKCDHANWAGAELFFVREDMEIEQVNRM
jgi:hypothetical protein